MENLAGNADCDVQIERELIRCGIEVIRGEKTNREVSSSIIGKLGEFEFVRAWYYWTVRGNVPLEVARELYADPVGKTDVRVAGHCGCPPPEEWAMRINEREEAKFVTNYHIDSEVGLRLFADTLKLHGLA